MARCCHPARGDRARCGDSHPLGPAFQPTHHPQVWRPVSAHQPQGMRSSEPVGFRIADGRCRRTGRHSEAPRIRLTQPPREVPTDKNWGAGCTSLPCSQRIATVEPVFANIRHTERLDRFTPRGAGKVAAVAPLLPGAQHREDCQDAAARWVTKTAADMPDRTCVRLQSHFTMPRSCSWLKWA